MSDYYARFSRIDKEREKNFRHYNEGLRNGMLGGFAFGALAFGALGSAITMAVMDRQNHACAPTAKRVEAAPARPAETIIGIVRGTNGQKQSYNLGN